MRALIAPDKFKGTLTARQAAEAIARGWQAARPGDAVELIPMSDGGDGFGEVLGSLAGAQMRWTRSINAAHESLRANWWFADRDQRAIIESARVIGLAMLPPRKFHPFQLDSFGLGRLLKAAEIFGARECVLGLGGSATNDGGFGLARSLGWEFLDADGVEIREWWQLSGLDRIKKPAKPFALPIVVALDVSNPLLGPNGCSRVYGPQKGLEEGDFKMAEKCLSRLAAVLKEQHGLDFAETPGAGAAGGLGFGLMAFLGARAASGFEIIAKAADLEKGIRAADIVITGEGAVDEQTYMGKGVGRIAGLCRDAGIPCLAMAGIVKAPQKAKTCFAKTGALASLVPMDEARRNAAQHLETLARQMAEEVLS